MIDVAIVGSGPAGLSAAINCVARNRSVVVLGRKIETSMLYKAEAVNNHLGMHNMTGSELMESFVSHAKNMNVPIKDGTVTQIMPMGQHFILSFEKEFIEAKAVILALGISKASNIIGESEFLGKGLSYCATCDGMLYKNKDVVLYTETNEGDFDVEFLAGVCKSVTYISMDERNINASNIYKVKGKPEKIIGDKFVTGVHVNNELIPCQGVFFVKKSIPVDTLLNGLHSEESRIVTNKLSETNIKGIFACGDCTGWPYQLSNAIGDGLVAAQQADKFLKDSGDI